MTRSRRTRGLKQLSDEALTHELRAHLKRAARTLNELDALLTSRGATWERVGVIAREAAGHLGRIVALCREGAARKLLAEGWEAPRTLLEHEGAAGGAA